MDISYDLVGYEGSTAERIKEIRTNLSYLYATPEGSCAGDRHYGIDTNIVGLPLPVAKNRLALEIMEKTETYVPAVEVLDIEIDANGPSGSLRAKIRITIKPEDEENDEDY